MVFLNHGAWQRPVWHGAAVAPGRFMPLPSIAYRLARVAVGDGIATLTLRPVNALDVVAGHALLLAAGGVLVAEDGVPVTYTEQGASRPSACFGGAPAAVAALRARTWRGSTEPRREPRVALAWPRAAEGVALDRAIGCLLGQVIGDCWVRWWSSSRPPRSLGPIPMGCATWPTAGPGTRSPASRPTTSELALALARVLAGRAVVRCGGGGGGLCALVRLRPVRLRQHHRRALGAAARAAGAKAAGKAGAAQAAADRRSQGNGSLMRVAPIGIWAGSPESAAAAAMVDSTLTHPHPVCLAACGAYAAAIATGIAGGDRAAMRQTARAVAFGAGRDAEAVVATLDRAAAGTAPADFQHQMGWVLTALGNAFFHLAVDAGPGRGSGSHGRRRRRYRHQRRDRRRAAGCGGGPRRLAGALGVAGADLPSRTRGWGWRGHGRKSPGPTTCIDLAEALLAAPRHPGDRMTLLD